MAIKNQTTLAIDALLYAGQIPHARVGSIIEQVIASGAPDVRVKLLLSEADLLAAIGRARLPSRIRFESIAHGQHYVAGMLSNTIGREKNRRIEGNFALLRNPDYSFVWLLITTAGGEFLKSAVRPFFRFVHPRPAVPVFRTQQIEAMLTGIEQPNFTRGIRIRQIAGRASIDSEGARKRLEADRRWTDRTIADAFEQARTANQWITDVSIDFITNNWNHGSVKIGRYGTIAFRGRGQEVFSMLLRESSGVAQERFEFLRDRARSPERDFRSRPFEIDFQFDAIVNKGSIADLKSAIVRIPRTTCTVLHGNPYWHAVMSDYSDGSVYEIVVLEPSRLTVIPQGRASVRALQRLGSYVFAHFHEGEFRELANE